MADADPQFRSIGLAPVTGRARIDVLDILRGVAILAIFYMNVPAMGGSFLLYMGQVRMGGWTLPDQGAWALLQVAAEGTQRGMLEMLFGAGMVILTARVMTPDGPVAVADLYFRRTLWLLAFGLADVFLFLWPGDVLHTYALAALFLFPFRRLAPRALVALGLLYAAFTVVSGAADYVERDQLMHRAEAAQAATVAHRPLNKDQADALAEWRRKADRIAHLSPEKRELFKGELKARHGSLKDYAGWLQQLWVTQVWPIEPFTVAEAFCTMLLGVALFKWGVIQGRRSRAFYLRLALPAYAFGLVARAWGAHEWMRFAPDPKLSWIWDEPARLAVTLGHVALINLLVQTGVGARLLAPFRAAGKTAFSLYVLQTFIGMWLLFPAFGLGLWDRFGWFGLTVTATVTIAFLLVLANIWVRFFAIGPLEWVWRSLAYGRRQPFRHRPQGDPLVVVGP